MYANRSVEVVESPNARSHRSEALHLSGYLGAGYASQTWRSQRAGLRLTMLGTSLVACHYWVRARHSEHMPDALRSDSVENCAVVLLNVVVSYNTVADPAERK